jgi:hypothetical protein
MYMTAKAKQPTFLPIVSTNELRASAQPFNTENYGF